MQDRKQIQNLLLKNLSNELSNIGFDKKIRGQSFWKQFEGGRAMIHFSFIEHESDFDVTISVSIRIDAIEDMINLSNKLLSKGEKQNTSTVGCEIGNLTSGMPKRYSITNQTNLDEILEQMMESIKSIALPFIVKYSNLETLLNAMISDDESAWILVPFHHRRAQNAVALAKLLDLEDVDSIIKNKRTFLELRKDYGLRMFEEFVRTINE